MKKLRWWFWLRKYELYLWWYNVESIEGKIKINVITGQCKGDLEPLHCPECGCTEFRTVEKSRIEGFLCEKEIKCENCDAYVGYWAYGSWMP